MEWVVNVPLKFPSLNEYINACRNNKYTGAQMKRSCEQQTAIFLRKVPAIPGAVEINFHWIEKDRRRDLDNIAFAKKFILDAMVGVGILPDDSQRYVKALSDSFEIGQLNAVTVTIREVVTNE